MKRREFLTNSALAGTSMLMGGASVLSSCSESEKKGKITLKSHEELNIPFPLDKAVEGKPLRFGLVGCGGRGMGAAENLLQAGDGLSFVAVAEALPNRLADGVKMLNEKFGQKVAPENCFLGFDAYQKVLNSDIDAVVVAVPSRFHPHIFKAAVEAGKHIFIEKPFAVDPVGVRTVMAAAKLADEKNISVVCGTQRRHNRGYLECYRYVASGFIGEIVGGACYWNTGRTWYRTRKPEWNDTEYILYNWLNYPFMGGDVITDHQIHNIDVVSWFMGNKNPVKAIGQGAKIRPSVGNKYDFFMVDYEFENNVHIVSSSRHIDGCTDLIGEVVRGTMGSSNCCDTVWDDKGNVIFKYEPPKDANGNFSSPSDYEQEHIDWVTSIRNNKPINDAHNMVRSTLICIMGRDSAYTGKTLTWNEILTSQSQLGPDITAMGKVDFTDEHPLPGKATAPHVD